MSLLSIQVLMLHPTGAGPARFVKADPGTSAGRAVIARTNGIAVVATVGAKARLAVQAGRIAHFTGWTGVNATVTDLGSGTVVWYVTGIPAGYGPMWYDLISRLAGKTEIRVKDLAAFDRPSDVARQFVQQFLPSQGSADGHGSAYTRNGGRSNWALADGFAALEPIMIHAGMLAPVHRPKPARRAPQPVHRTGPRLTAGLFTFASPAVRAVLSSGSLACQAFILGRPRSHGATSLPPHGFRQGSRFSGLATGTL